MSNSLYIRNAQVLKPRVGIIGTSVVVRDGIITEIDPKTPPTDCTVVDAGGRLLTPGLIDIHIHGVDKYLFETGPDALTNGLAVLPRFGVTCVMPTLYRVMDRASLSKLHALSEALDQVTAVRVPGFHLEGPFLALPGAGADTIPGDLDLLKAVLQATGDRVASMSISPDTPNILPIIEWLVRCRIIPFITHTRATADESLAAIEAGARHCTHFYDVFPVPPETEPGARPVGVVEAALADDRVTVDFICDGVHVPPLAIKAALKAKTVDRVLLITDANVGAGLPPGIHESPWGFSIQVAEAARINDPGSAKHGALAGSALTMDVGIANLSKWLDLPQHDIWAMGTRSVARAMKLDKIGDIEAGYHADLVLWDIEPSGRPRAWRTWVDGRQVYAPK